MPHTTSNFVLVITLVFGLIACSSKVDEATEAGEKVTRALRINDIQNVGTHNSYHTNPLGEPVVEFIERRYPWFDRNHYLYHFPSLDKQLETQGVRHLELDIFADPEGGKFNTIPINAMAKLPVERNIPELEQPGFKVLHIPQLDPNSTCWTFIACLRDIRKWSDMHPHHQPILIIVEVKDVDYLRTAPHLEITPFTDADFKAIESEILSVFPRNRIITPDDVQGNFGSLEEAVLNHGWPLLDESRGKVLFTQYHGRPQLNTKGRLLFPQTEPGNPGAAILIVEDIIADAAKVREWVRKGYLVRTRTGKDMQEVRDNDYTRFQAALDNGVHFISTDTPVPNAMNPEFVIQIPLGAPARCNPVTAPPGCVPEDIEDPAQL
jgi:Phosphoinositide phospholipase C, Ca2+-dependent